MEIGENVRITEAVICNNVIIPDDSILAPGTVIGPNIHSKRPLITIKDQVIKKMP